MAYLFVHFKEKETPDGEQVYFGLSKDGLHWSPVNNGNPVLESTKGECGVRDHTIVRTKDGKFHIFATDLSLAHNFKTKYDSNWNKVSRQGSKFLCMWSSDDLVNWSEQQLVHVVDENFGCAWAPDIIYDSKHNDYVIHWSSPNACDDFKYMGIYYSRTKDFKTFSAPEILYRKSDAGIIDSAIYEEDGYYYLFIKSDHNPETIMLLKSKDITGPYEIIPAFGEEMKKLQQGVYEAPTAYKLEDGTWCLMLDFYGVKGAGQGYVPFMAKTMDSGEFIRSDASFSFPYGFKHGTVLKITAEEYDRILEKYPNIN